MNNLAKLTDEEVRLHAIYYKDAVDEGVESLSIKPVFVLSLLKEIQELRDADRQGSECTVTDNEHPVYDDLEVEAVKEEPSNTFTTILTSIKDKIGALRHES